MEQDLIVFISSIMHDDDVSANKELEVERDYIEDLIGKIPPFTPWIYEHKPASSQDHKAFYLNGIRESTIVVILLAKTLKDGVKEEYDEAIALGKPILVFIKNGPNESDMKQFIAELQPKYKRFSGVDDLEIHVREAINNEIRVWSHDSAEMRSWRREQIDVAEQYWIKRQDEIRVGKKVPVQLYNRPGAILLLLPRASLKPGQCYDLKRISADENFWLHNLQPFCSRVGQELQVEPTRLWRATTTDQSGAAAAYVQIWDNGIIESVERGTFISPRRDRQDRDFLFINKFEADLIDKLGRYLLTLRKLGIGPPAYVFLALTGADVGVSGGGVDRFYDCPINWENVPIREVRINHYEDHPCTIVRGLVDPVWATYGWHDGSPNFLKDGSYDNKEVGMRRLASECQPKQNDLG